MIAWPRAHAEVPAGHALIKSAPEDFVVTELAGVEPEGTGEHLYVRIEKRGRTTPEVAAWLARSFGVPGHAVGYAGMKDKHAVTDQWFSVHAAADADALGAEPGIRVLAATRHRRKLRRGELAGNRFHVRLRAISGDAWAEALQQLQGEGVPNYFGPQRFGGDNLARARAWLPERRRRRGDAFKDGLYLSVLRAFLFNEVLGERVRDGSWARALSGDVAADGRRLTARGGDDGGATGPLWGRGRSPVSDDALARESAALAAHGEVCNGLEHAGLRHERRPLVLRATDLQWQAEGSDVLVRFALPPGGYATTLLGEAFDLRQPDRAGVTA